MTRILDVDGAVNLRDIGGYQSVGGGTVKFGSLYRSGMLAHLTDEGKAQFADLDVKLICDLRREDEKAEDPTVLDPVEFPRLELPIDPGSAIEMRKRLAAGLSADERAEYMTALTAELPIDHAESYATMFDALLGLDEGGFLVHCSAGKDRTGVAIALILHSLGVPKATVLNDYLFTNEAIDYEGFVLPRLARRYEPDAVHDKEAIMAIAGVRAQYLEAAYLSIEQAFDDVEAYLHGALKLTPAHLAGLRKRYLT